MAGPSSTPAQLGADNVIRFVDADHFLSELAGNLGRGRAFVRTRRQFELRSALAVEIEAPGIGRRIPATAVVVSTREGSVGLEFEDFEDALLPRLDRLGQAVEASQSPPRQEATVIGPLPGIETDDLPRSQGSAQIHITEEDEAETGSFPVLRAPVPEVLEDTFRPRSTRRPPPREQTVLSDPPFAFERSGALPTEDLRRVPGRDLETDDALPQLDQARQLRSSDVDSDDLVPPPPPEGSAVRRNPLLDPAGEPELSDEPEPHTAGGALADPPEPEVVAESLEATAAQDLEVPALELGIEVAEATGGTLVAADPEAARDEAEEVVTADPTSNTPVVELKTEAHAAPEPSPEPEPPAAPAAPAPPPPPTVPLVSAEALEDKTWPLPRMTRGGVLRVTDPLDLLGRFLSELRHGAFTVYGGPEGDAGAKVGIKIAGARVVSLEAEIVARVGPFLTLKVEPSPIAELLQESVGALGEALESLGLVQKERVAAAPPPPPPPAPVAAPPPVVAVAAPPPPPPPPPSPEPIQATVDLRPHAPGAPPAPVVEDEGPPETPKLTGDVVHFRRKKDLRHELDVNLKNGGLFVEAAPLPIRSKRRLKVALGGAVTTVTLEADVVFADAGRVGFSIGGLADALHRLEELLLVDPHKSDELNAPLDQDEAQIRTPSTAGGAAIFAPFAGTLIDPPGPAEFLDFPSRRIEHASGLSQASAFAVFEYLVRQGGRAVLHLTSGGNKRSVWLHEGSVAFVQAAPYEEASGLGRILVSQKRIHESQLRDALEKSKLTGKSLGRVLVLLGLVKKTDLSAAIREQSRLRVQGAFDWKRGNFEAAEWTEPPGDADLVLTKGLTVLGRYLRDRFEALGIPELEALFAKNLSRSVQPTITLESASTSLALQPKEMRFLELQLDGTKSIHDACLGSPVGKLASLRLVGVCMALGLVRFTDGNARMVRNASTRTTADNAANARLRKELQDRLRLVTGVNHFEVLGVHWSAHHRNYRTAYEKLRGEFTAKSGPYRDLPEELAKIVRAIIDAIDTAYGVLSDPAKRGAYRKQLFDQTERQYAADMLVKQGEVALMRGDRVGAIEMLETAVELDPSQRNRGLLTTAREGRR